MHNLPDANHMLDAFGSAGANRVDVTFLDIDGNKRGFRPEQSARQVSNSLPYLLPGLAERRNNLIIRPLCESNALVQLDDLDAAALARLKDVAFLCIATSPGNHRAWVALPNNCRSDNEVQAVQVRQNSAGDAGVKDFSRRLRKGTGADATASGATRVARSTSSGNTSRISLPSR
jgi:hypothetical protein